MKEMHRMSDHVGRIYLKTKRKEFSFISITRLPCVLLQTHVSSRRRRSLRVHATSRRNIRVYQDHVLPIASYTRGQCCRVRDRPSGSYEIPGIRKRQHEYNTFDDFWRRTQITGNQFHQDLLQQYVHIVLDSKRAAPESLGFVSYYSCFSTKYQNIGGS